MRYPDLFALGVRLFGVWLITGGVAYAAAFVDGKLYPVSDKARDSATANLIYATLDFALAAFFLLWTRIIVGWTYAEERVTVQKEGDRLEPAVGGSLDEPERPDNQ